MAFRGRKGHIIVKSQDKLVEPAIERIIGLE
jgi:hypothetical protein